MTLIKSISGIRGTIGGYAGDNLTPLDIVKFTAAYSRWLGKQTLNKRLTVVVGRDARLSGEMVGNLVEGTLLGCGIDVIDVGLCTTPGVELAVTTKRADGGIIITASHNPKEWNALKLLNHRGEFLSDEDGKHILELAEDQEFSYPDIRDIGRVVERSDFNPRHIDMVLGLPLVDVEAVRARKYRIVVDAVNSVGGIVVPQLLRRMGAEVVELNCEPTGRFAHNPEPLRKNLGEVCEMVPETGADMGIVVDPDVDRLVFVQEDGRLFGEEYTLVAVADYVLGLQRGNTVSNLSSTRALRDVTRLRGGEYYAAAVGEVNVVERMKEVGAVIGGEGNGGVIYPGLHYGRDALVGIALILTHLAKTSMKASELRATYPDYYMAKEKLELPAGTDPETLLNAVRNEYLRERIDDTDGVKIDFADGWVHMRRSNTEPIIRVYTEMGNQQSADELARGFVRKLEELATGKRNSTY